MALMETRGALADAKKELFARWTELQSVWHDTQSQEFENHTLLAIDQTVKTALAAMDQMNVTLINIKSDCE
jgi:hypothetical protein